MIVVTACTAVETAWFRADGRARVVRVPMGERAADGLAALSDGGERFAMLLSAGFSGGLDPVLHTGDVVLADGVRHRDEEIPMNASLVAAARGALARANRLGTVGPFVSASRVVGTTDEKRVLFAQGAVAVDMETGPLAKWACAHAVPFLAVRVVLDPADVDVPPEIASRPWAAVVRRPVATVSLAFRSILAGRSIGHALTAVVAVLDEVER